LRCVKSAQLEQVAGKDVVLDVDKVSFSQHGHDDDDYKTLRELFLKEAEEFKMMRERGETFLQKQITIQTTLTTNSGSD
jgi:hypothetical protein